MATRCAAKAAVMIALAAAPHFMYAADFRSPHPHRETRTPFTPASVIVPVLTSADLATLDRGEVVLRQTHDRSSGIGAAIEDVAAPPGVVWSQLLDFDSYAGKVPRVKVCENYEVCKNVLKTRFVVRCCPGYNVEYFVRHVYAPHANALVWTLDYERTSDLDDVHGIWRVVPHPTKRGWSRVEYSADLRLKLGVPGFILDTLTRKALREACAWLKTESEKQYAAEPNDRRDTFFGSAFALLDASFKSLETTVLDCVAAIHRNGRAAVATDKSGFHSVAQAFAALRPLVSLRSHCAKSSKAPIPLSERQFCTFRTSL